MIASELTLDQLVTFATEAGMSQSATYDLREMLDEFANQCYQLGFHDGAEYHEKRYHTESTEDA